MVDQLATLHRSAIAEQAALIALLHARPNGLSWTELTAEVLTYGSAEAVFDSYSAEGLFPSVEQTAALHTAREQAQAWQREEFEFVTVVDARYPAQLREIHQAPPFIIALGELRNDDPAVSVVGSREASDRGLSMARNIAAALVERDLTVIAGLALGIDTAAHTTALAAGGRTVGVIATGIRQQYPASSRQLHQEIAASGLILSQFWPDAPPQKRTFLMRNATMSGYGLATVVVEAGEYSGARAQARMAVEHGRPVILTDLVVSSCQWAQALVGRPGVTVASSLVEVMAAIDNIRAQFGNADSMLSDLAAL